MHYVRSKDVIRSHHPAARMLPQSGTARMIARPSTGKARRPWQDRWMLMQGARKRTSASRRLAHGFRRFRETVRDEENV
jgi:hypothetical protein